MAEPNTPDDPSAMVDPMGIDSPPTGTGGGDAGSDAGAPKGCTEGLKSYKHGDSRKDGTKVYWCCDGAWVYDADRSRVPLDPHPYGDAGTN